MAKKETRLNLVLPPAMHARLRRFAKRKGESASSVVRALITAHVPVEKH